MNIDAAALSLLGNRKENQDRVATLGNGEALLLVVVDGMGGHSQGAKAAQATEEVLRNLFAEVKKPLVDPQGFLTMALSFAHDEVVGLGEGLALDHRPRRRVDDLLVLVEDRMESRGVFMEDRDLSTASPLVRCGIEKGAFEPVCLCLASKAALCERAPYCTL